MNKEDWEAFWKWLMSEAKGSLILSPAAPTFTLQEWLHSQISHWRYHSLSEKMKEEVET